jgi:hypothetical protein
MVYVITRGKEAGIACGDLDGICERGMSPQGHAVELPAPARARKRRLAEPGELWGLRGENQNCWRFSQDPSFRHQRQHPTIRIDRQILRLALIVGPKVEPLGFLVGTRLLQGMCDAKRRCRQGCALQEPTHFCRGDPFVFIFVLPIRVRTVIMKSEKVQKSPVGPIPRRSRHGGGSYVLLLYQENVCRHRTRN